MLSKLGIARPKPAYILRMNHAGFKEVTGKVDAGVRSIFQQVSTTTTKQKEDINNHFIYSIKCNVFLGILIVANAVMIGWEIENLHGNLPVADRLGFFVCEVIFFLLFFVEMTVKLQLLGWSYFADGWNVFDYHVVACSFLQLSVDISGLEATTVNLSALRILRMLRLVRGLRLLHMFHELWMLVQGLFHIVGVMFWVGLLLTFVVYTAGIFLTTLVGHEHWYNERLADNALYFGSLSRSMLTLFQVITLEMWAQKIVHPLGQLNFAWYCFFLVFIIVCTWGLLNVIIGAVVQRVLYISIEKEEEVQRVVGQIESTIMDELIAFLQSQPTMAGKTEVDFNTFDAACNIPEFGWKLKLLDIPIREMRDLFSALDVDNTHSVPISTLARGLERVRGNGRAQDMLVLDSYVNRTSYKVQALHNRVEVLIDRIDLVFERLDVFWGMTEAQLSEDENRRNGLILLSQKVREKTKIVQRLDDNRADWYKQYLRKVGLEQRRSKRR